MAEPSFGQIYHTTDGKTVYFDAKTKQVSVFEGILTIEKIVEPDHSLPSISSSPFMTEIEIENILKQFLLPGWGSFDLVVMPEESIQSTEESTDILGPKDYFVLIPVEIAPLSNKPCQAPAWVSEFRKGHRPDYKGFVKYRILPEQWDWLGSHKHCPIVAWYSPECPAFVSLACQDHAKIIKPVIYSDPTKNAYMGSLTESGSIATETESVLTEEREI